MNGQLASLLKDRISPFTYVDKLSGVVRAIRYEREGAVLVIPVAIGVVDDLACTDSTLRDMIPDSAYQCIVYFEDRGATSVKSRTRGISWESHLRLVCWVNTTKFGGDPNAADKILQQFALAIKSSAYNSGPFLNVRHAIEGTPQRGRDIFSAYTYADSARQYLMWPYDAFAIDIVTHFRIKAGCEDQVTLDDEACWTPPTALRRREPKDFTCEELLDPTTGLTVAQLEDCLGSACSAPQIFDTQYLGDNAPKAVEFIALPGFYAGVALVDPDVLRFPGGTNANYVDEIGDVDAMATMAATLELPVIWVANLYSGTYADCTEALLAFAAAGVDVLAVSIANEPYLKKYDDRWPLPANYVDEAKAFADWFRVAHPGIPVAVPIAPSAAMKDPDSGEGGNARLALWRDALLACSWADLWELHSYAMPGEEAEHREALDAYVRTLCKQVIIGEWSVKQPEGDSGDYTANRIAHHAVMMIWLQANPRIIPIATEHNLISNAPHGYNKLTVTGGEVVLTPFGAATIPESGGDPCLITFEVYLHGVLEDTIVDVDPCDIDNAIAITLT